MPVQEFKPKENHVRREPAREHQPLGPLWLITIGMGAFFVIAAIVMAQG